MTTDKERVDFIEKLLIDGDVIKAGKNSLIGSQPEQEDKPFEIFTIMSQHVRGKSFRELIDCVTDK